MTSSGIRSRRPAWRMRARSRISCAYHTPPPSDLDVSGVDLKQPPATRRCTIAPAQAPARSVAMAVYLSQCLQNKLHISDISNALLQICVSQVPRSLGGPSAGASDTRSSWMFGEFLVMQVFFSFVQFYSPRLSVRPLGIRFSVWLKVGGSQFILTIRSIASK